MARGVSADMPDVHRLERRLNGDRSRRLGIQPSQADSRRAPMSSAANGAPTESVKVHALGQIYALAALAALSSRSAILILASSCLCAALTFRCRFFLPAPRFGPSTTIV